MAYELIYTSAPSGLVPGSSGFCIVACTKGMNLRLTRQLEAMSAYKPLYPHYADNAWDNPVSHSHCTFDGNGVRQHILSRICFNGVDYTGRSNKLASHLVLSTQEAATAAGGPASLFLRDGLFKEASWEIKTEQFFQQLPIPETQATAVKCSTWEQLTGDAGWGGFLAQSHLDNPGKRVYISYAPHQHAAMIHLIQEALNLLPEDKRWEVSFNTYFVTLPAGANCAWRCCPSDSEAMLSARRSPQNIVIDLNAPGELTTSSPLIDAARSGIMQQTATAAPQIVEEDAEEIKLKPMVGKSVPQLQLQPPVTDNTVLLPAPPPVSHRNFNMKILFILIPAVFFIIASAAGVTIYHICKTKQLYAQGNARCLEFKDAIDKLTLRCNKHIAGAKKASTVKECNDLLRKISSLLEEVKYIRENLKNLAIYDKVFSSREPEILPAVLDKNCAGLLSDLERTISALKDKKKRFSAFLPPSETRSKKGNTTAKNRRTPPPPTETASKKKDKNPPAKTARTVPKVAAENVCFLWQKPLSLLRKNDNITITLGSDVNAEDIRLCILDGNTAKVGEDLKCDDGNGRDAVISSKFSNGKLTIFKKEIPSVKKTFLPAQSLVMSIKVNDKIHPMYFQLGKSRLHPVYKDNTVTSNGDSMMISLPIAAPAEIYDQDNKFLDASAVKYILAIGNSTHELKSNGKTLSVTIPHPELAKLRRKKHALGKLEDDLVFILGRKSDMLKKCFPKKANEGNHKVITAFIASYHNICNNRKAKKIITRYIDLKENIIETLYQEAKNDSHCTANSIVSAWLKDVEDFIAQGEKVIPLIRADKRFQLKAILEKENTLKDDYRIFANSSRTFDAELSFIGSEIKNCISNFKKQKFVLYLRKDNVDHKQYVLSDKPKAKK